MKVSILSQYIATANDISRFDLEPDFRRATEGMKLAFSAVEKVMEKLPSDADRSDVGLVIGTSFGELQATYDFFVGLTVEKVARPLAFQNSLHHSTLGFVSRLLKFTGPGFTVSRGFFSGEDAIELGMQLLNFECEYVVVAGVDVVVPGLKNLMQDRAKPFQVQSGSGALLLSTEEKKGTAYLENLQFSKGMGDATFKLDKEAFYDSNAIAQVALAVEAIISSTQAVLMKPDGTYSTFMLSQHV